MALNTGLDLAIEIRNMRATQVSGKVGSWEGAGVVVLSCSAGSA
jgi:hypothetical protein